MGEIRAAAQEFQHGSTLAQHAARVIGSAPQPASPPRSTAGMPAWQQAKVRQQERHALEKEVAAGTPGAADELKRLNERHQEEDLAAARKSRFDSIMATVKETGSAAD